MDVELSGGVPRESARFARRCLRSNGARFFTTDKGVAGVCDTRVGVWTAIEQIEVVVPANRFELVVATSTEEVVAAAADGDVENVVAWAQGADCHTNGLLVRWGQLGGGPVLEAHNTVSAQRRRTRSRPAVTGWRSGGLRRTVYQYEKGGGPSLISHRTREVAAS